MSLDIFHHWAPAPVSYNDIHELEGGLSGMQVSVSNPVVSHPNQPEFYVIAELGKW